MRRALELGFALALMCAYGSLTGVVLLVRRLAR